MILRGSAYAARDPLAVSIDQRGDVYTDQRLRGGDDSGVRGLRFNQSDTLKQRLRHPRALTPSGMKHDKFIHWRLLNVIPSERYRRPPPAGTRRV